MKKIKVIDLLNKIANGEEVPNKIKCSIYEYEFNQLTKQYTRWSYGICHILGEDLVLDNMLHYEVEIIEDTPKEDKKIESIDYLDFSNLTKENKVWDLFNKVNEIIDKVNCDK